MAEDINLPPELVAMHPDKARLSLAVTAIKTHAPVLRAAYKRLVRLATDRGRRVVKYDVWAFLICDEALEAGGSSTELAQAIERLADYSVKQSTRNSSH
ncbi:hypothetical protein ACYZTX_29940 [Pseudomonas sp. MDT1-17]